MKHWDQDDQWEFHGSHALLRKGYGHILTELAKGLDIRFLCVAEKVVCDDTGVKVTTSNGEAFEGDIVLVTIPLGVLKEGKLEFSPPLPAWKVDAINNLGFGNLNKVALLYPQVFWDDSKDFFGCLEEKNEQRGECFMFHNMNRVVGQPVLLGLVAGAASYAQEEYSDEEIVNRAVEIVRRVRKSLSLSLSLSLSRPRTRSGSRP